MARELYHVRRGLAWTALLVLCYCCAVGLCKSPKKYGNRALQLASQHRRMVEREARCKFPQQRTVCVQDIYPNGSKRYTPHCTIVHRCAPDAGCCTTPEEHCQPKKIETIKRTFVVLKLVDGGKQRPRVESLAFDNHTECECRSKYDRIL
ncbi:snake venom vascular endothelial growth factor toxin 2-like [Haemaphysalis longicornis]